MSLGIALAAGAWGGIMGPLDADDKLAWETISYVFDGLMLFWLLQKLEQADVDVDEFVGRWPGVWLIAEGLLFAAVASLFAGAVSDGLLYVAASFDGEFAESVLKSWAWQPPPTAWQMERFLGLVVFGPVVEELVFRGLVLRRLAARWGSTAAIIISSVVFGMLHGDTAVGVTIFGVTMALLYVRSRTLVVPIAAHMANNLITYLIWFYCGLSADDARTTERGHGNGCVDIWLVDTGGCVLLLQVLAAAAGSVADGRDGGRGQADVRKEEQYAVAESIRCLGGVVA